MAEMTLGDLVTDGVALAVICGGVLVCAGLAAVMVLVARWWSR